MNGGRISEVSKSRTLDLSGRVALVTGAARGQGRSHAVTLARAGADVILFDLAEQVSTAPYALSTIGDLEESVALVEKEGSRAVSMKGDVRSYPDVQRAVEAAREFGRLDVVVANAGIFSFAQDSWLLSPAQWQEMLDICLTGVFNTLKAAVPLMIEADNGGSITITSSTSGFKGVAGTAHYCAAKHGVVGLMRTFALELAPYWIRVNCVHPTATATPMIMHDAMLEQIERAEKAGTTQRNVMDVEMLDPEDISNAVLWLASDQARYVTGITFPVDAGFMIR